MSDHDVKQAPRPMLKKELSAAEAKKWAAVLADMDREEKAQGSNARRYKNHIKERKKVPKVEGAYSIEYDYHKGFLLEDEPKKPVADSDQIKVYKKATDKSKNY